MMPGHIYRVGADWYVDTALLRRAAHRHVVEPMQGAYQILAPAGLVRCVPAQGLALPGQTGDLFRCQAQRAGQEVGTRLRHLASLLGQDAIGGEWDVWPATADVGAPAHACCASCTSGGPCRTAAPSAGTSLPLAERLIASEALGTVATRQDGEHLAIHPAEHRAPAWACGRYHECIGQILRFPDIAPQDRIARVHLRGGRAEITWDVFLDRQRRLMLQEILELVARQLTQASRDGAIRPSRPPMSTPGYGAWELAFASAEEEVTCSLCPYRLGTNLRCETCRRTIRARKQVSADQVRVLVRILLENDRLRTLPREVLRDLAASIFDSHIHNPHEPLTDAFFVRLERDVLRALAPFALEEAAQLAAIETAERTPLHPAVAVEAWRSAS